MGLLQSCANNIGKWANPMLPMAISVALLKKSTDFVIMQDVKTIVHAKEHEQSILLLDLVGKGSLLHDPDSCEVRSIEKLYCKGRVY